MGVIEKYNEEFDAIRNDPDYEFGKGQEFVARLLNLPPKERFALEDLFKRISDDVFERGINLGLLDFSAYQREKAAWEANAPIKQRRTGSISVDDFDQVFKHVAEKYSNLFAKVKGCFLFKLRTRENSKTRVVFVGDDGCLCHPEVKSFEPDDEKYEMAKMSLKEFDEFLKIDDDAHKYNYLVVAMVTPGLNRQEDVTKRLKEFASYFDEKYFVRPGVDNGRYDLREFALGFDSVESYATKVFNNSDLSFGDEQIIKNLFKGADMVLNYKFLKRGNTGAKVIEIARVKAHGGEPARFVVKYAELDDDRKINIEYERFQEHIEDFGIPNYTAKYAYTATHEAIKYLYASEDARTDSFPFSKLVDTQIEGEKPPPYSPMAAVQDLFRCPLFPAWEKTRHKIEDVTVEYLYGEYLKEDKVIATIASILNKDVAEIESETLVSDYRFIKEQTITTCQKVCHGDLHSENFFKDENGVYLIDFGWTGLRHAVIDHATVECSLKFKHVPFYVPPDELADIESKYFLGIESFHAGLDLSKIERPASREIFGLIYELRKQAFSQMHDQTSPLEYLIAIYILSFRQILYGDLNQRYAVASTELLGKEIRRLLTIKSTPFKPA